MTNESPTQKEMFLKEFTASERTARVFKASSAEGKWISEHFNYTPKTEWFAMSSTGQILGKGSDSGAVNSNLNKRGCQPLNTLGEWSTTTR